jgi:hypothetical protein
MKQWIKKKIEIKSKLFVKTSNKYFDILKALIFLRLITKLTIAFILLSVLAVSLTIYFLTLTNQESNLSLK